MNQGSNTTSSDEFIFRKVKNLIEDEVPTEDVIATRYSREITLNSLVKYLLDAKEKKQKSKIPREQKDFTVGSNHEYCKSLIDALCSLDEKCTNEDAFQDIKDEKKLHSILSLYSERIRIYNHCFLFNDVKPSDIFDRNSMRTPRDIQHRMFPFLKIPNEDEVLLPTVYDLITMEQMPFIMKASVSRTPSKFLAKLV